MSQGSEHWFDVDGGSVILNDTTIPNEDVFKALKDQHPEIATLVRWGTETKPRGRSGGIFERDRYVTPTALYEQFKVAQDAAENDDVVSGVLESTEALAFNRVAMTCDDEQEEDIWNQVIADIELDKILREMWRETFTVSQFYAAVVWHTKDFKVKKKTPAGNKSKKQFGRMKVPMRLTILDPMRVVPVGQTLFGQEQLAYIARPDEAPHFDDVLAGTNTSDQVVTQIIQSKYDFNSAKNRVQKQYLMEVTGARNLENVYILNPDNVFRHTATKPDYMRFANVRLKSVFELLDLKHQLRQMDRAYLLGATNFIILVKKGTDDYPAKQHEISEMATQIRGSARVPVIVGDHRIEIEIITPDVDMTLKPERYNTLDARITARLYQMFMTGNYAAGASGDDSIKLARVVARGMESRRLMILRTLEKYIFTPTFNKNDDFTDMPEMNFHPKRIALDFDNNVAVFMQDLRDRGDISRDTILSELDIDQEQEARLRKREAAQYDDVFMPTNVPFSGSISVKEDSTGDPRKKHGKDAPATAPAGGTTGNTKGAGRRGGGTTGGGGLNRRSGVSQPGKGTVPSKKAAAKPAKAEVDEDFEDFDELDETE